jgi:hypothetical protein
MFVATSAKQLFDHASLTFYFHGDRKYKAPLIRACDHIDTLIPFDSDFSLPVEAFDTAFERPVGSPYPNWHSG